MARDRASRPEATPLRLFVAVEVPDEVRAEVEAASAPWRERFPRARWVPRENQHLTVKFLGSTWPRLLEWVRSSVRTVAESSGSFEARGTGLGAFPSPGRARVLWAGLEDPAGAMTALAAALDDAMRKEFAPERRAFTPHLTVARFDPPVALDGLEAADLRTASFRVDRLTLFRSHLRRPAPVYERLEVVALGR
jgi:2'-5' RNA ligase